MIVGVGSSRDIGWWIPLVAVAGERARSQAQELWRGKANYMEKLGVDSKTFDSFVTNWSASLSEVESERHYDQRQVCNCRGATAHRSYQNEYAVLNLVDILDIIVNVGHTDYFFDGSSTIDYNGSGIPKMLNCSSCHGWFTGVIFDKQWDENHDERVAPPVFQLLAESAPDTPFTESWVYSGWSREFSLYDSVGYDERDFRRVMAELFSDAIAEDPFVGAEWKPTKKWSMSNLESRFDMWLKAGVDADHALMGVFLERASHQSAHSKAPNPDAVESLVDREYRSLLIKRVDDYAKYLIDNPIVGMQKARDFDVLVKMSRYDVDPHFMEILGA